MLGGVLLVSSATGWWALCLLGGLLSVYAGAWTALRGDAGRPWAAGTSAHRVLQP